MRAPKVREVAEAVRSLLSRPITSRFPAEVPFVPDGFRGITRYDEATCIGCGACAQVCPAKAIEMRDDLTGAKPVRRFIIHYDVCIFCGHCALNCTTETGIYSSKEYDLVSLDRASLVSSIEKELVLCEGCGAVIGTRDHILWTAQRLGPKRYANPTLAVIADGGLGLAPAAPAQAAELGLRPDAVRVICARCRRTTVVGELWG